MAIDQLFEPFLDQIAVIAENGSVVQYQGEVLFADVMTQEQYAEVAEKILANPHYLETGMVFSGQKAAYVLKGASQEYIQKLNTTTPMLKLLMALKIWKMIPFLKFLPTLQAIRSWKVVIG